MSRKALLCIVDVVNCEFAHAQAEGKFLVSWQRPNLKVPNPDLLFSFVGTSVEVTISKSQTVQALKSQISAISSVDTKRHFLAFAGAPLADSQILSSLKIKRGSEFHFLPNPKSQLKYSSTSSPPVFQLGDDGWFLDVSHMCGPDVFVASISAMNSKTAVFEKRDDSNNRFLLLRGLPWNRTLELSFRKRSSTTFERSRTVQTGFSRLSFSLELHLAGQKDPVAFADDYRADSPSSLLVWFVQSIAVALQVDSSSILEIRAGATLLNDDESISRLRPDSVISVFTAPLGGVFPTLLSDGHLRFVFKAIHHKSIDLDTFGRISKREVKNFVWFLPLILKLAPQCQFSTESKQLFYRALEKYQFLGQTTAWLKRVLPHESHEHIPVAVHATTDSAFLNLARLQGPMDAVSVDNIEIWDPVCPQRRGSCHIVEKMQVVKVFTSQAKPCLIRASYSGALDSASKAKESLFILKRGDDLRVDLMTQTIFYIFNRIWTNAQLRHTPYCFVFKVIPMALDYGVVECVPDCTTLQEYDWKKWNTLDKEQKYKFLCSAAGGYTAGWILGIRDRHKENMMVKDDHIFVQIDFGHMFDRKTKYFDAPRFAVPATMRNTLSPEEWSDFKEVCVDGFKYVRRLGQTIVGLICVRSALLRRQFLTVMQSLFDGIGLVHMDEARAFMQSRGSLMPDMSEEEACERLRGLIESGTTSGWKYIKNAGHVIAHAMK